MNRSRFTSRRKLNAKIRVKKLKRDNDPRAYQDLQNELRFDKLEIRKHMTNKEILGLLLREDRFL